MRQILKTNENVPQEERGGQKVECDDGYGSIREIDMSACRFAAGSSPEIIIIVVWTVVGIFACFPSCF